MLSASRKQDQIPTPQTGAQSVPPLRRTTPALISLLMIFVISSAYAQVAIPVHEFDGWWNCWSVRNRSIEMIIRDQVASVTVTDHVVNSGSRNVEVQYMFPLPPDAVIDAFTLVVDGRELSGQMLEAGEARRIYDDIVRRQRDPGLLEYAGYGCYRSSAFPLPPGKDAELVIHYTATCRKDGDVVEVWYPMSSGNLSRQPVGDFYVTADVQSAGGITNVYSPSLDLNIDRKSPKRVVAAFEAHTYRPLADFQLFYEVSRSDVGATFLTYWPDRTRDGYYLLMVSPNPHLNKQAVQPKDIIIVLDRSGSMNGEKIRQAREATRFILDNLNPGDRFNFIAYNDNVDPCFESLLSATRDNVSRAQSRLDRVDASGGTNIYQALDAAMSQLSGKRISSDRPAYVIFLTDGLPTVGNTSEGAILENTHQTNRAGARVFAFGVGYDVNVRLLDKLVEQNSGRSAYVKPNESIESKVSALYTRIKNPFMTDVTAHLTDFATRDDCPVDLGDLFENDQIVRAGRIYPLNEGTLEGYGDADCAATLTISGTILGNEQTFEYPVTLNLEGPSSPFRFVEKVWASRRVGQLLDEIQLHGRVQEVVDELIQLSKQYGIVTPYTSFLANENQDFAAHREIRSRTLSSLEESAGTVTGPQAQMDAASRAMAKKMAAPPPMSAKGFAMSLGSADQSAYERGATEELTTIRIVGNLTLYKKGDAWLTSETVELDPARDLKMFKVVQRYSDEYFALIRDNTPDENRVFAAQLPGEKLGIRLRGTAYLIE